ncbi:putative disease resistance protein At1g58400 [Brachypodium distachyon]|uniref:Rx N-terminal domain-containing protein n=1 Tax=Brachypodium distachyon TaxID=15368 RepID=A0A0Q3EMX5_BRADI|nr:putative disease resistance protein At1g58400 [Brachypodium distachyon]XP_024310173.1 putative disease resistance protein At1g58400 [Brachypodium distachyon]XP_024310174.1 putative disease resistance protein At1g58400 [Brachypodium distachyon]KQJ87652.1 hypothetical protein BRADI_4g12785v3 [Brachypodium distachyon]|eukprot:XP_014757711.1 putative disease resistance protein At1g58400 [Brachypodium distachyon]
MVEAAIVGAILSGALGTLPTLLTFIRDKRNSQVQEDVNSIKRQLQRMQGSILHPLWRGEETSDIRRLWIVQLRKLADEIEDCKHRFQFGQTTGGDNYYAIEIGQLKQKADHTSDMLKRYEEQASKSSNMGKDAAASMDEGKHLLALVQDQSENRVKVIAVAGFGGRKTDIARQVYTNDEVQQQFSQRQAWVSAAGKTMNEVLTEILSKVPPAGLRGCWGMPILSCFFRKNTPVLPPPGSDLKRQLISRLSDNKYLIVIDDVATEELFNTISDFPWPLDERVHGRIIVTTAIWSAAGPCSCGDNNLPPLAPDISTPMVLVQEVGPSVTNTRPVLSEARFKLCASALARTQGSYTSDYKGVALEDCLLYFTMFPRHRDVSRNRLIRRLLAEGLLEHAVPVPGDAYRSPHDIVDELLDKLISSNFIETSKKSNNGKVKRCKTPGVVFNYICAKAVVENFITLMCGASQNQTTQQRNIRRLSLHPYSGAANGGVVMPDVCSLRTMVVFPTANAGYGDILNFDNLKLLRVLDLKECAHVNKDHLRRICELSLLKYLSLGDNIGRIPKKIWRLQELETLETRTTGVVTMYPEVLMLPKLKHLLGKFQLSKELNLMDGAKKLLGMKNDFSALKVFLGTKCVLGTLAGFVVGDGKGIPQLFCHMGQLRKVKIWSDFTKIEETELTGLKEGIEEFMSRGISMPTVDYSLSIDLKGCSKSFLDFLGYPGRLTSLKLTGDLAQFGLVYPKPNLNSLHELCLSMTGLSAAAIQKGLSKLTCPLKFLKLVEKELGGLSMLDHILPFARLERICLVGEQSLHNITIRDLSQLASLHLLCATLGDLPGIEIESLESLKEVGLHSGVADKIKKEWETAASRHRPNLKIVSIQTL